MLHTEARKILVSLIQGRNPASGDKLPSDCIVHQPNVLRALLLGVDAIDTTDARAKRRAQLPDNVGQPWTTEEESKLVAAFKRGDSPDAIAHQHGRTLRAIEARLERMGLMTPEQRTTRGGFTGTS